MANAGGSVTDTGLVISALTFFFVVTGLLFMAGIGTANTDIVPLARSPGNVADVQNQSDRGSGTQPTATSNLLSCTISFVLGGFLGGVLGCTPVQHFFTGLAGLVTSILNYFVFVFELATFQNPEVPAILVLIIFLPVGGTLGFVAVSRLRGVGS